ncbi:MAG: hypothetical protein KTR21_16725 [Rhodobacteraceae bacterium]|nr:hypothetical protein [Paracoccaceae bacterium]
MRSVQAFIYAPVLRGLFLAALTSSALTLNITLAAADDGPPPPAGVLFQETQPGSAEISILFLPDELDQLPPTSGAPTRVVATGAYTSGDRFAPEGFVIRSGDATHPYPQGWDGLLLTWPDGGAMISDVSDTKLDGTVYNLRDRESRQAFLERAEDLRLSALQSHLLIRNGELDLRPSENAPTFRRRMLFQMEDGRIGVYDTSPRLVTLYEAAAELLDSIGPEMALNLDMGAYDFCEQAWSGRFSRCGLLDRDGLSKLTNLIVLKKR